MDRKVTSQDVADAAGVSRSAVSLVLNGRAEGAISAANQKAIRSTAEKLGYRPNQVARSLRDQTTHSIGVLTDSIVTGSFGGEMIAGASRRAARDGYVLLVINADRVPQAEAEALETLLGRQVDALVYAAEGLHGWTPPEHFLGEHNILLDAFAPDGRVTGVVPDEVAGGYRAARMLLDAGHRDIMVFGGTPDVEATGRRVIGHERAMSEAGLTSRQVVCGWEIDVGLEVGTRVLSADDRPTGVICANDRAAAGVMLAAARLGLRVPEDVSIVGYDDDPNVAPQLGLSTVKLPHWEMGEKAMDLLIGSLKGAELPAGEVLVDTPAVPRASVGSPSR